MSIFQKTPPSITWGDDETGWAKEQNCSYTVYRRGKWLRMKINEMITRFVQNPEWWDIEKKSKNHKIPIQYRAFMSGEYPKFYYKHIQEFSEQINEQLDIILPEIQAELLSTTSDTSVLTDFQFLLNLTLKRNWKSGCAICLTDKIMGTTCGCGHTEIAVFRPCGHSVCANPCFKQFIETKGQTLKPKIFEINGQKFTTSDMAGTTMDISAAKRFDCPYCKSTVEKVIRAEDTYCDDTFKQVIDSIFNKITEGKEHLFQKVD